MLGSRVGIARTVHLVNVARGGVFRRLGRGFAPPSIVNLFQNVDLNVSQNAFRFLCTKNENDDGSEDKRKIDTPLTAFGEAVSPHLRDKFLLFKDRDSEVILDIHEEFERMRDGAVLYPYNVESHQEKQRAEHNLERGVTGVYDIEDLVDVLEAENARDICVIRMPPEMMYADYMVLANGRSARHLEAIMEFVRKLYKKKMRKSDKMANVQGETCKTWMALDMGNIVLHLMMPEERNKYDIETLWAVGEKYDDHTVKPQDTEANALQVHLDFLESWRPLQEDNTVQHQSNDSINKLA